MLMSYHVMLCLEKAEKSIYPEFEAEEYREAFE